MKIKIFYDGISYRLKNSKKIRKLVGNLLEGEGKIPGDLNIIITDDESLRKINIEFLEHDYYTDVITFGYNVGDIVNGEIYISVDTVKANALNYKVSLKDEMLRVIIHGTLHLAGYDDKSEEEKAEMKLREDCWMKGLEG